MKTIEEIRLEWLNLLIDKYGRIADLNTALTRARTDATLSQIKNQAPDSKSGNPKNMGSPLAREIEERLGMERGTLDNPPQVRAAPTSEYARSSNVVPLSVADPGMPYPLGALLEISNAMAPEGHAVLLYEARKIAEQFPRVKANLGS